MMGLYKGDALKMISAMFLMTLSFAIDGIMCTDVIQTVCAYKNGKQSEYNNACEAGKKGAVVFRNSECPTSENGQVPCSGYGFNSLNICATINKEQKNYPNICAALAAKAIPIKSGDCKPVVGDPCTLKKPVCATKNGKQITYPNACAAQNDKATKMKDGACPCPSVDKPVCGTVNEIQKTFSSWCHANRQGASPIVSGSCPKTGGGNGGNGDICPANIDLVCAKSKDGKFKKFNNQCLAENAGYAVVSMSNCKATL
eukprot:NODE_47_length_32105_cov_1.240892.p14 type:complete len:257 gc:universal NODE_47_length_32105_cov_1.240892:21502-20732(-)